MAEPDDDSSPEPDDVDPLESLKDGTDAADTPSVEDGNGSRTRWNWNPVTDAGGAPPAGGGSGSGRSSFQFDLGSALARLDDGEQPPHGDHAEAVEPDDAAARPQSSEPAAAVETTEPAGSAPGQDVSAVAAETDTRTESITASIPIDEQTGLDIDEPPLPRRTRGASSSAVLPTESEPLVSRQRQYQAGIEPAPAQTQPSVPSPSQPIVEPRLPTSRPVTEPQPISRQSDQPSVFAASAPAPSLPPRPSPSPETTAPIDVARNTADPAPVLPAATNPLPTLPAAIPDARPAVAAPIASAPSTPDLNALRSAQLRAKRQQRQGKVFGRSLLAFMLIGALIAAALVFGRSYLFTTEWDATLTPIVDDIQEATGVDFDHTVPLITEPAEAYRAALLDHTFGQEWAGNVALWRALGLANGAVEPATVGAALAERTPAYFDPDSDTIFQIDDVDPDVLRPSLERALLEAYQNQTEIAGDDIVETAQTGLTGVSTPQSITERAVDRHLVRRSAEAIFGAAPTVAPTADLPLPIAYELAAVDRLGEAILIAAGVDPNSVDLRDTYPDAIYAALGDNPVNAPSALLRPGDQALADPVALGTDDWSLVWRSRLPNSTVDRLVQIVTADSYQPINRGGTTCFTAVFRTATEANGTSLSASLLLWAQRGPAGSQALATQLAPNQVQLEACDPGANSVILSDANAVDSLIDRQIDRLAG